jgi:hypothetical protein
MSWNRWWSAILLLLVPACVGSPSPPSPPAHASQTTAVAITPSAAPTPSAVQIAERLVLRAVITDPITSWHRVAFIPFGEAQDRLGVIDDINRAPLPLMPPSFAVAPDDSLWLLDLIKQRVVHYSAAGAFLGAVGGFEFDRFSPSALDVAFVGDRLYVVERFPHAAGSAVRFVDGEALSSRIELAAEASPVIVPVLLQGAAELVGLSGGYALADGHDLGQGPRGVAELDAYSGEITLVPGPLVAPRVRAALTAPDDQDLEVSFVTGETRIVQPIHVEVVTGPGPDAVDLEAVVGAGMAAVVPHGVLAFVRVSPARPEDQERYGGGRWLLVVSDDGSPIVWERLPVGTLSDEWQERHVGVGPDGAIYLMLARPHGMEIVRR